MQIESTNLPNILQYIIIRSSNLINMNDFDILTVVYNVKKSLTLKYLVLIHLYPNVFIDFSRKYYPSM